MKKRKLLKRIAKHLYRKSVFQMDKSERKIAELLVAANYAKWVYVDKHGGYWEFTRLKDKGLKNEGYTRPK